MGLLDGFLGKKGNAEKLVGKEPEKEAKNEPHAEGRFPESCSLCGNPGTDKKWAGQYWHVKCMRKAKKYAKGMI